MQRSDRIRFGLLLAVLVAAALPCAAQSRAPRGVLYQVSTIDALMAGLYDGQTTFRELKRHGDFGIGTLNALDGEMVALDGSFYQVTSDGLAHPIGDTMTTPFAAVTGFTPRLSVALTSPLTLGELQKRLDSLAPARGVFYAFRVDGLFAFAKTRSVPRQHRPYPKLTTVVASQPTFDLGSVRGTLVGFRCPYYVKGANVPGYHCHFITADRTRGGHLLDCRLQSGTLALAPLRELRLNLPTSAEFDALDVQGDNAKDLEKVEKGK